MVECETFRQSCLKLFGDDPELQPFLRQCDEESSPVTVARHALTCLGSALDPTLDAIRSLATAAARSAQENLESRRQFIRLCEQDDKLRNWIINQSPVLKDLKPSQRGPDLCPTAVVEFSETQAQRQESKFQTKLLSREMGRTPSKDQVRSDGPQCQSVFLKVWQEQKEKFSCLNAQGQTYLQCYYVFSALDPALALGWMKKGAGLFKAFGLLSSAPMPVPAATRTSANLTNNARNLLQVSSANLFTGLSDEQFLKVASRVPGESSGLFGLGSNPVKDLEARLGTSVQTLEKVNANHVDLRIYSSKNSEKIGGLDAFYFESQKELKIGSMNTNESFQKKGVGETLLELMVQKFPKTQVIDTPELVLANREVAESALKNGVSLEDAIKATPAYKIRAKMGFTEIVPGSIDPRYLGFKVRKPQN